MHGLISTVTMKRMKTEYMILKRINGKNGMEGKLMNPQENKEEEKQKKKVLPKYKLPN